MIEYRIPWENDPIVVADVVATIRVWQRSGVTAAEAIRALTPGRRVAWSGTWSNVMDLMLRGVASIRARQ